MFRRWARQCLVIILCLVLSTQFPSSLVQVKANEIDVSPGKYDLTFGTDFPGFGPVKLSYPNSSILTNSLGDLLFSVTLGLNSTTPRGQTRVSIYIPPDFSGITIGQVWTSFTNNYDSHFLTLSRLSPTDKTGPSWWEVTVTGLTLINPDAVTLLSEVNPGNLTFVANQTQYIRLFRVASPTIAGRYFFKAAVNGTLIDAADFPTLVVKGSRDPAYISGDLRDAGNRNPNAANKPIQLPNGTGARILATGVDYLGRSASAQAFINSTANGRYTLFGVAAGTYNITAYAAGYVPATLPYTVSAGPAQSLEGVDVYLTRSVNITGTVLSKSADGSLIQWGSLFAVNLFGQSRPTNRSISVKVTDLNGNVLASIPEPFGFALTTDNASTSFNFTIHREVGWDGRIPQAFANFTSGLGWGDYLLYAYVTSYIQLDEVRLHVGNETTQTFSTIPLIRTGEFNVTVHFRNLNSTASIGEDQIPVPATLTVSAYDQRGVQRAQNVTFVRAGASEASVELQGFSNSRSFGSASLFSQNYGLLPGTYQIIATVSSSPSIAGFANIGIRDFYYQRTNVQATIGLGDGVVSISFPVYKAGGINLTIYSVDDQTPSIFRSWGYPRSAVFVSITDSVTGAVYQANVTQPAGFANVTFSYLGLLGDPYDVVIRTLGYTQREIIHLNVLLGYVADGSVWMIDNPVIDLDVVFRHEGLLTNITSTLPFAQPINHVAGTPTRIEVFDQLGRFVAANVSYVPNNSSIAHFKLAGIDRYYGDPRYVWAGFYDTTDAASQSSGGLILYPWDESPRSYIVRIWVEGYYQTDILRVLVPARGNVSAVDVVDRATRIFGNVTGPDYYDFARLLSWANVTLEPNNYTLTRIIDVRPGNYTTSTLDGFFQLWVPGGGYGIGISLAGYSQFSSMIQAPWGSDINMQVWLGNYGQPSTGLFLNGSLMLQGEATERFPEF